MNDEELNSLLRQWSAPPAPASLRSRVLPARKSLWDRFFSGAVRPLAVAAALCLLVAGGVWWSRPPAAHTLSDFEPVTEFQPRIVRSTHETR